MALDLASLASVQAFATAFLSSEPRLDILIHNAGERQQALRGDAGGSGWLGAVIPCSQALPRASEKDAPYCHLTDGDSEAYGDPSRVIAHT